MRRAVLVLLLAGAGAPAVRAQEPGWDPTMVNASRPALEQLERRFEAAAESPAYSEVLRAEARAEASRLRERLRTGDFRPGDRVALTVEQETALSDTFTVAQARELQLPGLGAISLDGVLRSEVEQHLRTFIGRFVRDPVVRARGFVRVSITGEVPSPGFYAVPSDIVVSDALRFAGGVTSSARVRDVSIRRDGRVLWEADELSDIAGGGRTLDQLDVRSGDQIVVGRRGGLGLGGIEVGVRAVSLIMAIPFTIVGIVALF
jgi:polysaccharide export outer membrane protein